MTTSQGDPDSGRGQPTEEELRAAYEAELKRIRVEHVLLEDVVTLINLGMRRTGLSPSTEAERDPEQVRLAIEAIRALLPLIEQPVPEQAKQIRDALAQLQLAFVRIGGGPGGAAAKTEAGPQTGGGQAGPPGGSQPDDQPGGETAPPTPGEPGPAQRSGRLWIPGQ
jgi:hypothetical protein